MDSPGKRREDPAERGEVERLVVAATGGDREAFAELVRRYQDRIFWVAYRIVNSAEEARDVTQEVLVRLWRTLPRYDPTYAFSTWLHRMTVNLAIDARRRHAARPAVSGLDEQLIETAAAEARGEGDPADAARTAEVERIFAELRDLLPPQQRAAFALREMDGLTTEEVAEVLGVSPSTVRNHLFQARRVLREALLKRYPEYAPRTGRGAREDD